MLAIVPVPVLVVLVRPSAMLLVVRQPMLAPVSVLLCLIAHGVCLIIHISGVGNAGKGRRVFRFVLTGSKT
jgi:hypothetical protein